MLGISLNIFVVVSVLMKIFLNPPIFLSKKNQVNWGILFQPLLLQVVQWLLLLLLQLQFLLKMEHYLLHLLLKVEHSLHQITRQLQLLLKMEQFLLLLLLKSEHNLFPRHNLLSQQINESEIRIVKRIMKTLKIFFILSY